MTKVRIRKGWSDPNQEDFKDADIVIIESTERMMEMMWGNEFEIFFANDELALEVERSGWKPRRYSQGRSKGFQSVSMVDVALEDVIARLLKVFEIADDSPFKISDIDPLEKEARSLGKECLEMLPDLVKEVGIDGKKVRVMDIKVIEA